MPRATRKAQLQVIAEDEALEEPQEPAAEVLAVIDELERNVEEKIHSIMAAATEAVFQLKNEFTRSLVKIPKKTRDMPLAEFKQLYPDDFQSGALAQIGQKFAAMQQEIAAKQAVGRGARTAAKRAAEPETVLRTTRRRAAPQPPPPQQAAVPSEAGGEADEAVEAGRRAKGRAAVGEPAQPGPAPATKSTFNGRPLQTPMPFGGEAVQAAVTLLTQKRGGRTRGAPATEAAVITTADGQQWAVGKQGLASIPETHRQEVQELLTAQFEFVAAALGRTVFARGRR